MRPGWLASTDVAVVAVTAADVAIVAVAVANARRHQSSPQDRVLSLGTSGPSLHLSRHPGAVARAQSCGRFRAASIPFAMGVAMAVDFAKHASSHSTEVPRSPNGGIALEYREV